MRTLLLLCTVCIASATSNDQILVNSPQEIGRVFAETWKQLRIEENRDNPKHGFLGNQLGSLLTRRAQVLGERMQLTPARKGYLLKDEAHTLLLANGDDASELAAITCGDACAEPSSKGSRGSLDVVGGRSSQLVASQRQMMHARGVEMADKIMNGALARIGALNPAALRNAYDMDTDHVTWETLAIQSRRKDEHMTPDFMKWIYALRDIENEQSELQQSMPMNETLRLSILDETENKIKNLIEWFRNIPHSRLSFVHPKMMDQMVGDTYPLQLVATEEMHAGEQIMELPMMGTLSHITAKRIRTKQSGNLGDALKATFAHNEVWGMTLLILHEFFKETAENGPGSKWGPLLRTLGMKAFSSAVAVELSGTYAVAEMRRWQGEAEEVQKYIAKHRGACWTGNDVCQRSFPTNRGYHTHKFNLEDIKWGLWVVHQNCIYVNKASNGKRFLALLPFAHLMKHKTGAGGRAIFDMDGSVRVFAGGDYMPGETLWYDHGENLTDIEMLLKFHSVSENKETELLDLRELCMSENQTALDDHTLRTCRGNPNARMAIKLPGVGGDVKKRDLIATFKILTEWRDQMKMPPRLSAFHGAACMLNLLGDDAEEGVLLNDRNKVLAGLTVPTSTISAQDQLMLSGAARTVQEANDIIDGVTPESRALQAAEGDDGENSMGNSPSNAQLYPAPDPEDDPNIGRWMEKLSDLLLKVKESVEAGAGSDLAPGDLGSNATQTVLNQSQAFLEFGVVPEGGLDALDLLLLKKMTLIENCGAREDLTIGYRNVSEELMCALRVHFLNETEVGVFCPGSAMWYDTTCTTMNGEFNARTPVSASSERLALSAGLDLILGLLNGYETSIENDIGILQDIKRGIRHESELFTSAIRLRVREKWLLQSAEHEIRSSITRLSDAVFARMQTDNGDGDEVDLDANGGDVLGEERKFKLRNSTSANNETLAEYVFQIDVYSRVRAELDQKEKRFSEMIARAKEDAGKPREVAWLTVNLKQPNGTIVPVNVTVHAGEDLAQISQQFAATNGIPAANIDQIISGLRAKIVNLAPALVIVPVITRDGHRHVLTVREGDEPTRVAEIFTAMWTTDLRDPSNPDRALDTVEAMADFIETKLNRTSTQRELVRIPIDAPDGRKHILSLREGNHHDLGTWLQDWCAAHDLPRSGANQLFAGISAQLPRVLVKIPVEMPGRRSILLQLLDGGEVDSTLKYFIEEFSLVAHGEGLQVQLRRALYQGMNPNAYMMN